MSENILKIEDLHYKYPDGTCALNGVNMDIKRGEVTAILGGNGAGKSTLFHHLNGINKPSFGKIYFNGKELDYSRKGLKKLRQDIGIVFQDPDSQLFSASVYQDISFGPMNMKLKEDEIRRRVDFAIKETKIEHLKNKPTHALSFGQKKRVSIAGILVMEPKVLILDEPTAGLDPMGVSDIMGLLMDMKKKLDLTIIISTHDIDIVPLYCDKVFVMDKGKVILEGTPDEVFREKEKIRKIHLRLPRVAHLMEILKEKDGFNFNNIESTIGKARKAFNVWKNNFK